MQRLAELLADNMACLHCKAEHFICKRKENKHLLATLTEMVNNTIAFINDEMLDMAQVERFLPHEGQNATWATHNNVWAVVSEGFLIFLDGYSAKEDSRLHRWHIFLEALILTTNLECQLSCVAQAQDTDLLKTKQRKFMVSNNPNPTRL